MRKEIAMYQFLEYGYKLEPIVRRIEEKIKDKMNEVSQLTQYNQWRVLQAFRENQVGEHHFTPSTGYGFGDPGRNTLEQVYADLFGTEAAIVRPQIISGTHAISACLFGLLRAGDELIYITGKPYDSLDSVIGDHEQPERIPGSLAYHGVDYQYVPLLANGEIDYERIGQAVSKKTKVIGIQRSRGYADRPSFSISQIKEMVQFIRQLNPDIIIFVDNCYGEFVEREEPTHVGVDILAGSLIKNPGGGIVKTGGYIAGRKELVELVGTRLFAPGIGLEGGASLYSLLEMYQGLFLAPHVVGEALKGAIFTSAILEELGFKTNPLWNDERTDLIQSVEFGSAEKLITFCQGIQKASPIDAYVTPQPGPMPGYKDEVIMAGGTFIQGSSIEFTADGPIRPPYLGFVQGGLTLEHVKIGILTALNELIVKGLLEI